MGESMKAHSLHCSDNPDHEDSFGGPQEGTKTLTRPKVKKPSMYKVILLNDDFTPMDFVIYVLMHFFKKSETDATQIMLDVHKKGAGLAGVYPFEIAETKVHQVHSLAQAQKYPLKCQIESE